MSKKRTLHSFFSGSVGSPVKKTRVDGHVSITTSPASAIVRTPSPKSNGNDSTAEHADDGDASSAPPSSHPTYPFPIASLPDSLSSTLSFSPYDPGFSITDAPDLDLLYYHPYVPPQASSALFKHLRSSLPFYRVTYTIKRGAVETVINTPRYTTVFGLDETARFTPASTAPSPSATTIVDAKTSKPLPPNTYSCKPRPIPSCLDDLRKLTESSTGCTFNFCLVNYYADGKDSISYHSDDERFLGAEPAIASFSLGAQRDFLLRHKPPTPLADNAASAHKAEWEAINAAHAKPKKYELSSGDMILMRGRTQGCWLHSIPKRSGKGDKGGRINITFRKAMVRGGTENYYKYNVGTGPVYVWKEEKQEMVLWDESKVLH